MSKKTAYLKRRAKKISWAMRVEAMTDQELVAHLRANCDMFLSSDAWRALRQEAIKKYGSTCLKCGKEATRRSPINIDHVKPRKYFPKLALDINNLQPLCARCNKNKGNKTIDYRLSIRENTYRRSLA